SSDAMSCTCVDGCPVTTPVVMISAALVATHSLPSPTRTPQHTLWARVAPGTGRRTPPTPDERPCGKGSTGPDRPHSSVRRCPRNREVIAMTEPPNATAMAHLDVWHATGDRFLIDVRGHDLLVDQPIDAGGGDVGPTPTELFVASLAACIGFYAGRFLRRHELPVEGLRVSADFG